MKVEPSFSDFAAAYDQGCPQLVSTRLVADLETPVSAMLKLSAERPYSFLLESVEGGAVRGRYSIIGLDPDLLWRAEGDKAEINTSPLDGKGAFRRCRGGTLTALRELAREFAPRNSAPFAANVSRRFWLSQLRHSPARRAFAYRKARSDRRSRRTSDASHHYGDL